MILFSLLRRGQIRSTAFLISRQYRLVQQFQKQLLIAGGIILLFKTKFQSRVNIEKLTKNFLWCQIDKSVLGSPQDLFICGVYIPPGNSPYFDDEIFNNLESDVAYFFTKDNIMLLGDFNARTSKIEDYVSKEGNTFINFSDLLSKGKRLPNNAIWRWFRRFSTRLSRDIHTWKFASIANRGPHGSCGQPFEKRGFCNSSKLLWYGQPRPEAPKYCCLTMFPIVWHSIGTRYPHLKIQPSSKGETTWAMWSPPPFAKRGFGNFSKLLSCGQQRLEAPKSCCLPLIAIV